MRFNLPPRTTNANGAPRHVGVEIEFAGVPGADAAHVLASSVGGTVREASPHRFVVEGSELGDLAVELDTKYAHADKEDEPDVIGTARKILGDIAQSVVPYELITPPLTLERLPSIDRATASLREAGALGTLRNPLFAFGLHLNPEAADLDTDYLLRILRAFVVLNGEIRQSIRPDPARRILGWADAYGTGYCRHILSPAYAPDEATLIDDYIAENRGRNYDLDMLPLFAEIDAERIERKVGDPRINARPAFHYRLPDCRIDEAGWSVARDWNLWVGVEELAENEAELDRRCRAFLVPAN